MFNAGIVLWLLIASPLRAFVLEREAVTLSLPQWLFSVSITRFGQPSVETRVALPIGVGAERRLLPALGRPDALSRA